MNLKGYIIYAASLLRVSMSLVFLWFGLNHLLNSSGWIFWLPTWMLALPVSPQVLLMINGAIETLFGILLVLGLLTRASSAVLTIYLLMITAHLGYNDVMIRNLGLTLAMLSVFLQGPDLFCIESRWKKSKKTL